MRNPSHRDTDPDYTLGVGDEGEDRLNIINEIYNQSSKTFLTDVGIRNATRVLDVGCGTGEMACWMAQQLPVGGKVLALDYSAQQLAIARKNAAQFNILNIQFIQLSAYNLRDLNTTYDFIYSRFVMAHLKNPETILDAMCDVLTPGGVLACEDAKTSEHYCNPPSPKFDRYVTLWTELRRHKGADPDFGVKLSEYFTKRNLAEVTTRYAQVFLTTPRQRSIFALNLKECRYDAIDAQLTTEEETSELQQAMEALGKETRDLRFSTSVQTSGKHLLFSSRPAVVAGLDHACTGTSTVSKGLPMA